MNIIKSYGQIIHRMRNQRSRSLVKEAASNLNGQIDKYCE